MDDLLQEFVSETRETLEALAGEIVAWEGTPGDRARLDAIFRFVHTVKGSCGFLDLPRLARLSHAAEDALASVRDGLRTPDTALVDAVLAIVDRIGELVEAIDSGASLDDSSEELLIAALTADAAPAAAPVAAAPAMRRASSRTIRLGVDLLDRMMGGMSDMVLARNELARRLRETAPDPQVEAALERLTATVADMRDTVTRTRMQRIETLFAAVPRLVRDTAADVGKQVVLSIDGGDVELDREMIELLRDPLVHIVRNAIDHGIEAPDARRAVGKADAGRLTIAARQSGNQIVVDIGDDGAGIDVARLCAKAVRSGLHSEAAVAAMTDAARLDIIFAPGLSTRDTVTALSGRGVGMDVVRANIEQIGGRVELSNRPGQGLSVSIHVPLTLSIMSTVVMSVADQSFALPRQAVEEIVPVGGDAARIDHIGDAVAVCLRGERLPLLSLAEVLGLDAAAPRLLAVITSRKGRYALGIDRVLDVEELVIRPAAPAVMALGVFAGQTLPDNGSPLLLLDAAGLAAAGGLCFAEPAPSAETADTAPDQALQPGLLFVDRDGRRRAIALAVVDRVEPVAAADIAASGDRTFLSIGGALVTLHHAVPIVAGDPLVALRLTDGERELAYAIAEPLDIVALPTELAAVANPAIAGIALIEGEPVEIVDAYALFAEVDAAPARRPLCLLHGDEGGWMTSFLAPTLEAAGYRCVTRPPPGEPVALALAMDDVVAPAAVPLIRLSRDRAGGRGIYRYDRPALIAAIDAQRRTGGALRA